MSCRVCQYNCLNIACDKQSLSEIEETERDGDKYCVGHSKVKETDEEERRQRTRETRARTLNAWSHIISKH